MLSLRATRWRSPEIPGQSPAHDRIAGPATGYSEQVFEHELIADRQGVYRVLLVNERLKLGQLIEWRSDELPCFVQWMMLRAGVCVVGLEPSTHHIEEDQAAREDGSMIWLNHGESRSYHLLLRVLDGDAAIAQAAAEIEAVINP